MADKEDNTTSKDSRDAQDPSRRKFIKNTGIATGGVVGGTLLGGLIGNPFSKEQTTEPEKKETVNYSETRMFFKRKEDFDVLSSATECIFPEDELGAGAIELGAPYFIDKQLAGPWGENAQDYMKKPFVVSKETPLNRRDIFLQGIRKITEVSKKEHDENFYDLEEDQQIEILEKFDKSEIEMLLVSSGEFFNLLRESTLEGSFSDPMYGGNKDMKGWEMKEYPGPRIAYVDLVEKEEFVLLEPVSLKNQK